MRLFTKILNIVIDILMVIMLVISFVVAGLALASRSEGIPHILGYAPLSVQSDSMSPTFEPGDLIISKVTDSTTTFEKGDVITFTAEIAGEERLNTHRIDDIKTTDDGITYIYTKGDNAPEQDPDPVFIGSVLAKYTGTHLEGMGTVYDFITSQMGFFFVVLLPLIIFFIYEAVRFVRNLLAYNREKAIEEATAAAAAIQSQNGGLSEEEMKQAVEQYLAQQTKAPKSEISDSEDNTTDTEE